MMLRIAWLHDNIWGIYTASVVIAFGVISVLGAA